MRERTAAGRAAARLLGRLQFLHEVTRPARFEAMQAVGAVRGSWIVAALSILQNRTLFGLLGSWVG